ncbi:MAG: TonB family protein [Flavobacteriales bacterium]|nr:TonB family protein [Flavobacteriales bacterium]
MKKLLLALALFTYLGSFSQDTLTTYYTESWNETSKKYAKFYRKSFKVAKKLYRVKDYFIDGQLQMTGNYSDKKYKKKTGNFIYYFENGQKEMEGKYTKNKAVGEWTWWYDNGNLSQEGQYDAKGKRTGHWKDYYEEGGLNNEGDFVNDMGSGAWKFYFESGELSAKEMYEKGELIDFKFYNEDGSKLKTGSSITVSPKYSEDDDFYKDFMKENLKYPKTEKSKGHEGMTIIKVNVGKDGKVTDHEILLTSGFGKLDDEALRVCKLIKEMIPGKIHNRFAEFNYFIPVIFKL